MAPKGPPENAPICCGAGALTRHVTACTHPASTITDRSFPFDVRASAPCSLRPAQRDEHHVKRLLRDPVA
ncbi:MAG: hypothetical protein ABI273_01490, partial [Lacunisphaera sp.]